MQLHLLADSHQPQHRDIELKLAVVQAYGEPMSLPVQHLTLLPPLLQVKQAQLVRNGDQQELAVTLSNAGSALQRMAFSLGLPGAQTAEALLPALGANGEATVSFGLPADFKPPRNLQVALSARHLGAPDGNGFPLYDWQFDAVPVHQPGALLLYGAALMLLALAAAVYYQRVYRHPAVLRLTAAPEDLRQLDLAELATTRLALRRARRLEPVLGAAGVHASWLDQALQFEALAGTADASAPLARAEALVRRLGLPPDALTPAGLPDTWVLLLGENFPLNLQRLRLCLLPAAQAAQDTVNGLGTVAEVTLLIGATPEQRSGLMRARAQSDLLVVPSGADLTALWLAERPLEVLASLIARQVPVTHISPYQTGAGVARQSLFFGRAGLIAQVMGRDPANYLVVGGRQVGKSSLLKELQRRYAQNPQVDCHYLALADANAAATLAQSLGLPAGSGLDEVLDHLRRDTTRRSLLLIDEADSFVERERQPDARGQSFATLQRLRALSEEGRAHFILAGFWSLYRQVSADYQSPLKNFGTVLTVGALEPEACRELATRPMALLGIRWAAEVLVDELVERCGQRANLISIACDDLLKHQLGRTERQIEAGHLQRALGSDEMRAALAGWSGLGSSPAEQRLDQIAVYATATSPEPFTLTELHARLEAQRITLGGPPVSVEALRQSLMRLELAFVLRREGTHYRYQVPLQQELIAADDVDYLLRNMLKTSEA